jgi:signal transduction histidine kinase
MPAPGEALNQSQIDRLLSNLRWALVLAMALILILDAFATGGDVPEAASLVPQILLLIVAVLYNIAVAFFLSHRPVSRLLPGLTLVVDVLLTIGLILSSGGLTSPLLLFGFFPVLTAALRFRQPVGLLVALIVAASFGGALYLVSPGASWAELNPLLVLVVALVLTAVVGSFLNEGAKGVVDRRRQAEIAEERRKLRAAREHSRLTFELASTLSATLNYNRVLRAVLEVGEKGMQELGQDSASQAGAVLLFSHDGLRVAEARHLAAHDLNKVFQAKEGALAVALDTAEPVIVDHPAGDPELGKLVSLQACGQAIVVPLRAGFESFGVVIFGSSRTDVYTDDLENLLVAICNQAIVALQNAQLYQDLQEEKERIVAVEEDARKKLARSLHDGPTQSIAAIAMRVDYVQGMVESNYDSSQISDELRRIEDLARRTTTQIRHMLFTLRPLILESQGLKAALEQYIRNLPKTDDVRMHLEADPEAEHALDRRAQGIVFYVIEEAIGNALKHARADQIWVRLKLQGGKTFIAEVEDDGKGFDVDDVQMGYDRRGSLGLINMHERAELAGGRLAISSAPGRGTEVRLTIELEGMS